MALKTEYESAKWDSLQAAASIPVGKMLRGTANNQDIEVLSKLVAKMNALANSIFKSGLIAIEERADYLVQQVQQKRQDEGKKELNPDRVDRLYNASKKRAMKELSPELLQTVDETIADHINSSSKETQSLINDRFDLLGSVLGIKPKGRSGDSDGEGETDSDSGFLGSSGSDDISNEAPPKDNSIRGMLGSVLSLVSGKDVDDIDGMPDADEDSGQAYGKATPLSDSSVGEKIKHTMSSVASFFTKKNGSDEVEESKKASTWWRQFGIMNKVGNAARAVGKKAKDNWLELLLGGLATMLFAPELIKTVALKIAEFFNWDNIKKMYNDTVKYILDKGPAILSSIVTKVMSLVKAAIDTARELAIKAKDAIAHGVTKGVDVAKKFVGNTIENHRYKPESNHEIVDRYTKHKADLTKQLNASNDAVVAATKAGRKPEAHDLQNIKVIPGWLNDIDDQVKKYKSLGESELPAKTMNSPNNFPSFNMQPTGIGDTIDKWKMPGMPNLANMAAQPYSTSPIVRTPNVPTIPVPNAVSAARAPNVGASIVTPGPQSMPTVKNNGIPKIPQGSNPVGLGSFPINSGTNDMLNIINSGTLY